MRATCTRDALLRALAPVARCAEHASNMPILANVRLSVEAGELRLAATDLNRFATAQLAAPGATDGAGTVPAKLLREIVKSFPVGATVEITRETLRPLCTDHAGPRELTPDVTFRARWTRTDGAPGRCEFKLLGMSAADFPKVPDCTGIDWHAIPSAPLHALLVGALPFVSTDEQRPYLNNVEIASDGATVRALAVDGNRLHRGERSLTGWTLPAPIRVPRDGARALVEALADAGTVEIATTATHLHLRCADGAILSVGLSDVAMPPTAQLKAPVDEMRSAVRVDAQALRAELLLLKRTAPPRGKGALCVTLGWAGSTLRLARQDSDTGDVYRDLPARITGASGYVGMNVRYLLETLPAKLRGEVTIGVNGELDPVGVRLPGASEPAIVMPVRDSMGADAIPALALEAPETVSSAPDPLPSVAFVEETVAHAFGMAGLPNTVVLPDAPIVESAPAPLPVVESAPVVDERPDPLDVLRAMAREAPRVERKPDPAVAQPESVRPEVVLGAPLDDAAGTLWPVLYRDDYTDTGLFLHGANVYRAGAAEGGGALLVGSGRNRADALRVAREHLAHVIPISRALAKSPTVAIEIPEGEIWTPCKAPARPVQAGHPFTENEAEVTYYTDPGAKLDWACVRKGGRARWYEVALPRKYRAGAR